MKRIRETMSCEKGFTLVELLVVIGIIGILAMMLLPQFGGMRDRARIASCQSNLKNVGTQLEAFYADMERYPTDTPTTGEWDTQFAILEIAACTHDKSAYVYMAPAVLDGTPSGVGAAGTIYDIAGGTDFSGTAGGGTAPGRIDSYLVYCEFHDGSGTDAGGTASEAAETQLFITNNGLQRYPQ